MNCATAMAPARAAGHPRTAGNRGRAEKHGGATTARQDRALFIDIDGVLHPTTVEGSPDAGGIVHTPMFGWLPVLAGVLRPHPGVALVVHSTWRYTHDVDELRGVLGALGSRVVGATPPGPRYESILSWLHLNPAITDYRILDDDQREFPRPLPAELILCNPSTGITGPKVLAALRAWLES
jgi:hypothetical protein